jgi:carbon-monoxide dehydrogenase large subunit
LTSFFNVGGTHVSRLEDFRLLTGAGKFASDWNLPGQLHGYFLRSDRAHARIVSIDIAAARNHPGVHLVLAGEDAVRAACVRPLNFMTFPGKNGMRALIPERPALAHQRVRFVGEPVALVVAESAFIAQDAAQLIEVEYQDLPCVIAPDQALAAGAPQLHESVPGNLCFAYDAGDAAAVEAAFSRATHVTRLRVESTRVVPNPMEPRACLVDFDANDETYTIHVCVQGAEMMRRQLAGYTGIAAEKIKVVARDVGGGFGSRSMGYPEYCAAMLAARATGRPVKWVSTRSEGLQSDTHGRANVIGGELALGGDGKFLAMRLDWISDLGAYPTPPSAAGPIGNARNCLSGVYRIAALYAHWRVAYTNGAPVGNYRGAGRPDIAYVIERLVSQAAAELGVDGAELRRRNFIPKQAFPYRTPTGSTYEIADFYGLLAKALDIADWDGYAGRRAESEKAGKLRGRGIATVIESTGAGAIGRDEVALAVDEAGRVVVFTTGHSQGQGHETTLAMIVAKVLEIEVERVTVRQEIRDPILTGNHTGGSRTMIGPGSACHVGALELIDRGKRYAAEELGVEPSQVEYCRGEFRYGESPKAVSLTDLAQRKLLAVVSGGSFGSTYPNDCHIAEVEIDPGTGLTRIVSYVAVGDCGVVINHSIVEGQIHGALAQGAGQVFGEHALYDPASGQLLTGSFLDYFMPRAGLLPEIRLAECPTPSRISPLGVKGVGETGCTASIPALVEAVLDALRPLGISHLDMPLTPVKIWSALNAKI